MFLRSGLCYNTTTARDMDKRASQAIKTKKEKGERRKEHGSCRCKEAY